MSGQTLTLTSSSVALKKVLLCCRVQLFNYSSSYRTSIAALGWYPGLFPGVVPFPCHKTSDTDLMVTWMRKHIFACDKKKTDKMHCKKIIDLVEINLQSFFYVNHSMLYSAVNFIIYLKFQHYISTYIVSKCRLDVCLNALHLSTDKLAPIEKCLQFLLRSIRA